MPSLRPKPLELSIAEAAAFVGVSYAQMQRYLDLDDPPQRLENKKIRSDHLGKWVRERLTKASAGDKENSHGYQKTRRERAMADKVEMENKVRAGDLVEADDVEAAWADIATRVKTRMLAIPSALAPVIAAETDRASCLELLDERIREALEELASSGDAESQ